MAEWNEGIKTFTAAEDLAAHRRVKLDSSLELVYADAGENVLGVTLYAIDNGDNGAVKLKNYPGTVKLEAAGAFSARDMLWGAADGKVDDSASGEVQFYALQAATASGDIIECLPWDSVVQQSHVSDPAASAQDMTDNTGASASGSGDIANLSDGSTYANDHSDIENNFATIVAEYNKLKDDVEANNSAIDSILAQLASLGLQASS